jgi:hypothetical protein
MYFNFSTLSEELLSVFILGLRPAFWPWDMTMYLVFISVNFTSIHLHLIPHWIPLLVTTFLTLVLNVFSLQGKDASKPAGNCLQLLMVLPIYDRIFTNICSLIFSLIFRLWSSLLSMGVEVYPLITFQACLVAYALKRANIWASSLCCAKISQPNSYYLQI